MQLENQHIIIVSNEPWGDVWFSKHHYANELAKLGNKVFFIDPIGKWKLNHLWSFKSKKKKINENLYVISYKNNLPLRIFKNFFEKVNDFLNLKKIWKFIPKNQNVILWQFDLFRFVNPIKQKSTRIYHVVDPYANHSNDTKLAKNTDLIICTAMKYMIDYTAYSNKLIYIPHGISEDEFNVDSKEVDRIKDKYGDFIIITGTISHLTDLKILISTIESTNLNILVAGNVYLRAPLQIKSWEIAQKHSNFHYLGTLKATELKNWIAASKLCLIIYNFKFQNLDVSSPTPLKKINYLAQKKPIISTLGGEFLELEGKGIFTAKNTDEFTKLVHMGLENILYIDSNSIDLVLKKRTYPFLIHKIEDALNETIK